MAASSGGYPHRTNDRQGCATTELLAYYRDANGDDAEGDAQADFSENLRRRIIDAADQNAQSNDRRMAYLHRASIALFVVLALTALAGIPFVADQIRSRNMPKTDNQPKPAQTVQRPAEKPQFPSNRVLKEGQMPKR